MTRSAMLDRAVREVLDVLAPDVRAGLVDTFLRYPHAMSDMFVGDVRRSFREICRERVA